MSLRSPPPWASICSLDPVGADKAAEKVLLVALLCGFIRGNGSRQKIQTEETLMLNPFAPLVRIPSTIVLFGVEPYRGNGATPNALFLPG